MSAITTGDFVHVVATVNTRTEDGTILYVNPSSTTIEGEAAADPNVELLVTGRDGETLRREAVVVRRSSPEDGDSSDLGLIQADIPRQDGMKSVALLVNGKEVSRYEAGAPAPRPPATLGLVGTAGASPNRRRLTLAEAADLAPAEGVTYTVQVKPDTGGPWNTISVGRPTPHVEIDRNQFAGARMAEVRVLRTTGFDEDVVAEDSVDLF
jgi:hypothetical protein